MDLDLIAVYRLCRHCGRWRRKKARWRSDLCWSCYQHRSLRIPRSAARLIAPHRNIILTDKGRAACNG